MDIERVFQTSKGTLELAKETPKATMKAVIGQENNVDDPEALEHDGVNEGTADEPSTGQITTSSTPDSSNEAFVKFRTIISDYLNGDTCNIPEGPAQSVLSSFSLAGYLDHALPNGKDIVITKLLQQCCFQLQEILNVSDGICFVHEEPATAIIQVIQMQLLNLYPKYSTQGYEALYSCPPTIYISPLCIPSLGSIICKRLGFPTSCIKVMKMTGRRLPRMEKSLQEDVAAKRVPLMIIASSGSHHSGQVDNLVAVSQLSKRFNAWLHLEGHLVAHLGLGDQSKRTMQVADSLHLDLKQLLGIPCLPYVTMYRHCEIALQRAAFLTPSNCSPFNVVPLWFALQSFEASDVLTRFRTAVDLSTALLKHLLPLPNIKMMSHVPRMMRSPSWESNKTDDEPVEVIKTRTPSPASGRAEGSTPNGEETVATDDTNEDADTTGSESFTEAITIRHRHNVLDDDDDDDDDLSEGSEGRTRPEAMMNMISPVIVFQYRPTTKENQQNSPSLVDDLNLWLVQVLERACPEVHLDIVDVDDSGYALRFSPYDCKAFPSMDIMDRFLACFDQQLEILNATVEHKSTLVEIVNNSEELQLVELPGWAGLGGVRYLPSAWRSNNVEQLPDQGKEEINKVNRELVNRLKATDSAFSVGEGRDGLACVRFGMVVAATDVSALANLVRQSGLDLEESTLALETMAVLIRKGIEAAQAELQRETEEKLWQEGLLRHIPVVGSLVNYFSPPLKMPIKGRSLDLKSGRMEKSDVIFNPTPQPSPKLGDQQPVVVMAEEAKEEENKKEDANNVALPVEQPTQ